MIFRFPAALNWEFSGAVAGRIRDEPRPSGAASGARRAVRGSLLAVWLYATLEGIGAARAIEHLCEHHAAYRWLCGGVPVNHDMLSAFRRDSGAELDRLLTQSLTGLIAEGLVTLEEVMIDGTKLVPA